MASNERDVESEVPPPAQRQLRCKMVELVDAFDDATPESGTYLDLDTGEVITITQDTRYELEAIYEDLPQDQTDEEHTAAFVAALEQRSPPEWMHEVLIEADAVEQDSGRRYLRLPERDISESYREMAARVRERVLEWLAAEGMEPIEEIG
jgi:hypothetical protein